MWLFSVVVVCMLALPAATFSLEPAEVLVIANRFVPESVDIARY